jgi:hypothetical protein
VEGANVIEEIIRYLREMAQTCTSLARVCPHPATAHGLEEIAHDLMARAKDLEDTARE